MTGSLLLRGMIVGLIAGVIAFIFAYTAGEPSVDRAVAFEHSTIQAENAAIVAAGGVAPAEEPALVSRAVQSTWGLLTGIVLFGTAAGGIFSLVFALAYGRLGTLRARTLSAVLALAAFVSVAVAPQIKYPANPPAVGSDDTIVARTTMFFLVLVVSIAMMVLAVLIARRLWAERGAWTAGTVAAAAYIGVMAAVFTALPQITEIPAGFSAEVIWDFRLASLGIHAILWTVIGLGFGLVAERRLEGRMPRGRAVWS